MKKILYTMVVMLMTCAMTSNAEEKWGDLYIPDIQVENGTTSAVLQLCLKNNASGATGFVGLQASIVLPEGFTVTKIVRGSRLKAEDFNEEYYFTFNSNIKEDASYINAFNSKSASIEGTDGEVAKITISIPEGAVGKYTVNVNETEVANGGVIISTYTSTTAEITVNGPAILRGDANGDGEVNMDDATFVTNIILGTEDATEAADVNGDGQVSMPDAMFIVNKIHNGKFPDEE